MAEPVWWYLADDALVVWHERDGELQVVPVAGLDALPLYFRVRGTEVEVGALVQQQFQEGLPGVEARFLERAADPTQLVTIGDEVRPLADLLRTVLHRVNAEFREPLTELSVCWGTGISVRVQEKLIRVVHAAGLGVRRQVMVAEAVAQALVERGEVSVPTLVLDTAFGDLYASLVSPAAGTSGRTVAGEARVLAGHGTSADRGAVARLLANKAVQATSYLSDERVIAEAAILARTSVVDEVLASTRAEWIGLVRLTTMSAAVTVVLPRREVQGAIAPRREEFRRFVDGLQRSHPFEEVLLLSEVLASEGTVEALEPIVGAGRVRRYHGPVDERLREGAYRRAYPTKAQPGTRAKGAATVDAPAVGAERLKVGARTSGRVRSIGRTNLILTGAGGAHLILPLQELTAEHDDGLEVGQQIDVFVTEVGADGRYTVSLRAAAESRSPEPKAETGQAKRTKPRPPPPPEATPAPIPGPDLTTRVRLPFVVAALGGTHEFKPGGGVACMLCDGTGKADGQTCPDCRGTGEPPTVKLRVPAATMPGAVLRLRGMGGLGQQLGPRGDLIASCEVEPHSDYRIQDGVLATSLSIDSAEAKAGTKVKLEGLDGRTLFVTIPAGTQDDAALRLRKAGLADGDLIVKVRVRPPVPKPENSERQRPAPPPLPPRPSTSPPPPVPPQARPPATAPEKASPSEKAPPSEKASDARSTKSAPQAAAAAATPFNSAPSPIRRAVGAGGRVLAAVFVIAVVLQLVSGNQGASNQPLWERFIPAEPASTAHLGLFANVLPVSADADSLIARLGRGARADVADFQALSARELEAVDAALTPLRAERSINQAQQILRRVALERKVPMSAFVVRGDTMSTAEAEVIADLFASLPIGGRERGTWFGPAIIRKASTAHLGLFANVLLVSAGIRVDDAFTQRFVQARTWYTPPSRSTVSEPSEVAVHNCLRWQYQQASGDEEYPFATSSNSVRLAADGRVFTDIGPFISAPIPLAGTVLEPSALSDCRVPAGGSWYFSWQDPKDAVIAVTDPGDSRLQGAAMAIAIPMRSSEGADPIMLVAWFDRDGQRTEQVTYSEWMASPALGDAQTAVQAQSSPPPVVRPPAPAAQVATAPASTGSPQTARTTEPASRASLILPTTTAVEAAWMRGVDATALQSTRVPSWAALPRNANVVELQFRVSSVSEDPQGLAAFVGSLTVIYTAGASNARREARFEVRGTSVASSASTVTALQGLSYTPRGK